MAGMYSVSSSNYESLSQFLQRPSNRCVSWVGRPTSQQDSVRNQVSTQILKYAKSFPVLVVPYPLVN